MRTPIIKVLFSGMLLTATIAVGNLECMAAAPLAPNFSTPVRVFSGRSQAPGSKVLATDGVNFYTAFITAEGSESANTLKLASGSNDGKTWGTAGTIIKRGPRVLDEQVSVAVTVDVASPVQNIVHVVWNQLDDSQSGSKAGIYYSWASDADLNSWSEPTRINGPVAYARSISIVSGKSGELHVVFLGKDRNMYYSSAASYKAVFTKPVIVPGTPMDDDRAVDVALDGGNNLHIGFATVDNAGKAGVKYTQKPTKSENWTVPVDVIPPTAANNHGFFAIAASDSNNIHIASTLVNEAALDVYSSKNGGKSWIRKNVTADKPTTHVSIVTSPDKSLTVGVAFTNSKTRVEDARIFRSADGAIWSGAANIANETSVNLVVDSNGKTGVLTYGAKQLHSFSKEQ